MPPNITSAAFAKDMPPHLAASTLHLTITQGPRLSTGEMVTIRIAGASYDVHKAVLCKRSPYFSAMFNGRFAEATNQSAELEALPGVVSPRSFEALLQWVYCGYVHLDDDGVGPGTRISTALEFLRFADMAGVPVDDAQLAGHIRAAMVKEPVDADTYTAYHAIHHVSAQHVRSASALRRQHPVRVLFAQAATAAYLTTQDFKFAKELQEIPEFGADVLREVTPVLGKAGRGHGCAVCGAGLVEFVDPFTQQATRFDGSIVPSAHSIIGGGSLPGWDGYLASQLHHPGSRVC